MIDWFKLIMFSHLSTSSPLSINLKYPWLGNQGKNCKLNDFFVILLGDDLLELRCRSKYIMKIEILGYVNVSIPLSLLYSNINHQISFLALCLPSRKPILVPIGIPLMDSYKSKLKLLLGIYMLHGGMG
jgi:hypothetical protein